MTERFCRQCRKWHGIDEWPIECLPKAPEGRSSDVAVPYFISDTMDPTEHVDGRLYTSKSKFRAVTKAHDLIEVGNDPARHRSTPRPAPDKAANMEAIKRAEYLVQNNIPASAVK